MLIVDEHLNGELSVNNAPRHRSGTIESGKKWWPFVAFQETMTATPTVAKNLKILICKF